MTSRFAAIFLAILATCAPAFADDSAASIAAGGLVPRRETRIVMAKEVLRISEKKVVVDYDFRNDTDEEITTEVAFPVPPYHFESSEEILAIPAFEDFKLSIEGNPARYAKEAKAIFKGKDFTHILLTDGIDVASFGHQKSGFDKGGHNRISDLSHLPSSEQKRLAALGLISLENDEQNANWIVHLQYYWKQSFPPHSTTHIRHEYKPFMGETQVAGSSANRMLSKKWRMTKIDPDSGEGHDIQLLKGFCTDPAFLNKLADSTTRKRESAKTDDERDSADTLFPHWVDFILTTANTWQRPIEDFTLIVERPQIKDGDQTFISFCSPGPVEKLDADHLQVHLTNFIPKAELHIGFFGVPEAKSTQSKLKK